MKSLHLDFNHILCIYISISRIYVLKNVCMYVCYVYLVSYISYKFWYFSDFKPYFIVTYKLQANKLKFG